MPARRDVQERVARKDFDAASVCNGKVVDTESDPMIVFVPYYFRFFRCPPDPVHQVILSNL